MHLRGHGCAARHIDAALAGAVLLRTPERELGLTARERDVLRLLADGHSNESIGHAMSKLGAATRTQAVASARRKSLIS